MFLQVLVVWCCLYLGYSIEVEPCLEEKCDNVNLTHSVVLLQSTNEDGDDTYTDFVHFMNDSETVLATMFFSRNGDVMTFGITKSSDMYEVKLVTIRDTIFYSLAIENSMLLLYMDGLPVGAWNWEDLSNITNFNEDISINFAETETRTLSLTKTDRCDPGQYIVTENGTCASCNVSYGAGMSTSCVDVEFCPITDSATPYGTFMWPLTLITRPEQEMKCAYDGDDVDYVATRHCQANQTWSELDTSACNKSEITDSLKSILESKVILHDDLAIELSRLGENVEKLGRYDVIIIYDIINQMTRQNRSIDYHTAKHITAAVSYVTDIPICLGNPYCYWLLELLRDVAPKLSNQSRLVLSDNVGMYYMREVADVLNVDTFCQHNFHDLITGCQNDGLRFLQVMENEVKRLIDGLKAADLSLTMVFSKDYMLFPSRDMILPANFNETIFSGSSSVGKTRTIAAMVVDINLNGVPKDTKTSLLFTLNADASYNRKDRSVTVDDVSYDIIYECAYYETNTTLASLNIPTSLLLSDIPELLSNKVLLGNNTELLGDWVSEGCETSYDVFQDAPSVLCKCGFTSRSFTILAKARQKRFPSYYVEILILLTCITCLGLVLSIVLLVMSNKWMAVPKAAQHNLFFMGVLLTIVVLIVSKKMAHDFSTYVI